MSQNSYEIGLNAYGSREPHITPAWIYAFCIAGPLLGMFLVTGVIGTAPDRVLKDPAGHINFPAYIGFFSNMGILAWWTAAVSCLTAATVLWLRSRSMWLPLAIGGVLSAVLCLDDFMLLHEEVFPTFFGIPEQLSLGAYAGAMVIYLLAFQRFHRAMETQLLLIALMFFGISVTADLIDIDDAWWGVLLEDGSKFTGIVVWATYHSRSACRILATAMPTGRG